MQACQRREERGPESKARRGTRRYMLLIKTMLLSYSQGSHSRPPHLEVGKQDWAAPQLTGELSTRTTTSRTRLGSKRKVEGNSLPKRWRKPNISTNAQMIIRLRRTRRISPRKQAPPVFHKNGSVENAARRPRMEQRSTGRVQRLVKGKATS